MSLSSAPPAAAIIGLCWLVPGIAHGLDALIERKR